jgi:hypothetical protein
LRHEATGIRLEELHRRRRIPGLIFRLCDENRLLLCLINSIGNVIGLTRKKSPSTARVT